MWQEQGASSLDTGAYSGGYVHGKSVSLTPFSSNGGSVAAAQANMARVINFTPMAASSGTLTGESPLESGAYGRTDR